MQASIAYFIYNDMILIKSLKYTQENITFFISPQKSTINELKLLLFKFDLILNSLNIL